MLFMAAPQWGVEFSQQRAAVISSSYSGAVVHGQGMVRAICCFVAAPAVVRGGYPAACNRDQQQWCWYRASFTARGMQPRSAAVTLVLSFLLGTVRATCCSSQLPRWRVEVGQRRAAAISSSGAGTVRHPRHGKGALLFTAAPQWWCRAQSAVGGRNQQQS